MSCQHNLSIPRSNIESCQLKNKPCFALFLDMESTSDNVIPDVMNTFLLNLGCPLVSYISSENEFPILTVLSFIKTAPSASPKKPLSKRVPQGRIFSPTLFNIYVSKISEDYQTKLRFTICWRLCLDF